MSVTMSQKLREQVNRSVRQLWTAFSDLSKASPESMTTIDANLWFEVTNHPAIQERLGDAFKARDQSSRS